MHNILSWHLVASSRSLNRTMKHCKMSHSGSCNRSRQAKLCLRAISSCLVKYYPGSVKLVIDWIWRKLKSHRYTRPMSSHSKMRHHNLCKEKCSISKITDITSRHVTSENNQNEGFYSSSEIIPRPCLSKGCLQKIARQCELLKERYQTLKLHSKSLMTQMLMSEALKLSCATCL